MKTEFVDFDPEVHTERPFDRIELFRGRGYELYFDEANEKIEAFLDFKKITDPEDMIPEQKIKLALLFRGIEEDCPWYGRQVSVKSEIHGIQSGKEASAGMLSVRFTEGLYNGTFIGFELSVLQDYYGFVMADYGLITKTMVDIDGEKHILRTPLAIGEATPYPPIELN